MGDVGIAESTRRAVEGCDCIVHLAAPSSADSATPAGRGEWDRSRVAGARNLVNAAHAAGVRRFVLGSGYWLYGHYPGTITEESASQPSEVVAYNWEAELVVRAAFRPGTLDVMIVRPGMVYGDGAWFRPMVDSIRAGRYRYVGDGANHWSTVALPDCGLAFRTIVEHGRGGETYLVADDEPVKVRDLTHLVARELGATPPHGLPLDEATTQMGPSVAAALAANQSVSNSKLRGLGWRPRFTNYREGIPPSIRAMLSG